MMDDWNEFSCKYCGADLVSATGNKNSDVLIVGEMPGETEIEQGIPMCGKMGIVLRSELAYLGLDLKSFRRTNLWLHTPNKNQDCFKMGVEQVLKEAKGKRVVLLLGSDTVKYFTGKNVSDVNGLQVQSTMLSAPTILAGVNPAIVFHGTVGEVRFLVGQFKEAVEENTR
jgi:uracil-DNA glycosylase family 4